VEKVSNNELKQVIFERLKELPEMQRKVLALYYGEDMHLREIAEVFGLTESRICQIHSQAILAIRAYLQRFESGLAAPARRRTAHDHHHRHPSRLVCVFGGFMLEGGNMKVLFDAFDERSAHHRRRRGGLADHHVAEKSADGHRQGLGSASRARRTTAPPTRIC
jgi:predicted DNA-binding protein YlxM (UPF0122 family)